MEYCGTGKPENGKKYEGEVWKNVWSLEKYTTILVSPSYIQLFLGKNEGKREFFSEGASLDDLRSSFQHWYSKV